MTDMCQWARDKLGYDGCGSHNPLSESPAGDIGLSAEELEAQALEWSRLRLDYIKEWKRKVAGPNGSEYKAQVNEARRAYLKRKPEVGKRATKRLVEKNRLLKRHYCAVCDKAFGRKYKLTNTSPLLSMQQRRWRAPLGAPNRYKTAFWSYY